MTASTSSARSALAAVRSSGASLPSLPITGAARREALCKLWEMLAIDTIDLADHLTARGWSRDAVLGLIEAMSERWQREIASAVELGGTIWEATR